VWWRSLIRYKVSWHLALDRVARYEIQLEHSLLVAHLAMLPVVLGLLSMTFSGYDVTTEIQ
jgi:hypothetical protein